MGRGITGGIGAAQLLDQTPQRDDVVDIVPGLERHGVEPQFGSTVEGLPEHALGAPVDLLEEATVPMFQTDQIVPAILSGAEDEPVAGRRERMRRRDERACREGWAVGIDQTRRAVAGSEEILGGVIEAVAE